MAKALKAVQNQVPAALSTYARAGQDEIDSDDIYMPRLKLAQSMTPEVKDGRAKEGDLINSITGEIILEAGKTMPIIVVMRSKEYILWDDRKGDDRGLLARAYRVMDGDTPRYRWDKPDSEFQVKVDGKTKVTYKTKTYIDEDGLKEWGTQIPGNSETPPAASEHQNFVIAMPDRDYELIAMSLSKTAVGPAKRFLTSLRWGEAGTFTRIYRLGSAPDSRGDNKFVNYIFDAKYKLVDDDVAHEMNRIHQSLKGKTIVPDQDHDETDDKF